MTLGKFLIDNDRDFMLNGDVVLPFYDNYIFSAAGIQDQGQDWNFIYQIGPAGEPALADCEIVQILEVGDGPYHIELREPGYSIQ